MKTYLTYGALTAFASAVLTLILHILGFWTNPERLGTAIIIAIVVGLVIQIVGIVLGTRADRATVDAAAGYSYGKAFKAGLLITLVAALLGVIFSYVYFQFINPNFAETNAQWTQNFMHKMGAPESQIEKALEDIRTKSTVTRQMLNGLIGSLIFGTIITLITSAVLKRPASDEPPVSA